METDLAKRLKELNDVLQEKQVGKKTLVKQKEDLENDMSDLKNEIKDKYGIEPEKLKEALQALDVEIDGSATKLEKKLGLKEKK